MKKGLYLFSIGLLFTAPHDTAGEHCDSLTLIAQISQVPTRAWQITKYDLSENAEQGRGRSQITEFSQATTQMQRKD